MDSPIRNNSFLYPRTNGLYVMKGTKDVNPADVYEQDELAAMCNPDFGDADHDIEQAVQMVGTRFDSERVKFDHDTYNKRLTLETPTLKLTVRLNDVTLRPKEQTAMLKRKVNGERDILLLEGEDAYYAIREALTVKQERQMEKDIYGVEKERESPHPSLTVGERNPSL